MVLLLYAPCIALATNSAIILRPLTLLYALLYAVLTPVATVLVTAVVTLLTSGNASCNTAQHTMHRYTGMRPTRQLEGAGQADWHASAQQMLRIACFGFIQA